MLLQLFVETMLTRFLDNRMMPLTPIGTYLPSIIRDGGFSVTTANLLTIPSHIIGLIFSIIIAASSDRYGEVMAHALIGVVWQAAGYAALWAMPVDANRWSKFAAATVTAAAPSWHGMHIAYMSANLSPAGKRALALGAIIGSANICGVPGSQIYSKLTSYLIRSNIHIHMIIIGASDAPRYLRGNMICVVLNIVAAFLFMFQRFRYDLTNRWRNHKWNNMSEEQKLHYLKTTKHKGSNRLDYRFRI